MTSRILIADDTATVLEYLDIVFSRQGFTVTKAGHGEQALALAQHDPPDVILLDVMMPGLDGLEVTRRLRADPRTARIPILLYSAVVGDEIRARARAAGADEFLGKTVNHGELVIKIREWMAARWERGATRSNIWRSVASAGSSKRWNCCSSWVGDRSRSRAARYGERSCSAESGS